MNSSAVAAQTKLELAMTLRRGESLLVTLAIPIGILVFFGKVNPLSSISGDPIDFLVPGVLSLAVMASAMVSLGIATGFERRYGVLKRLGSTPLSRGGLLAAKTLNVLAVEVLQVVVIVASGVALGWKLESTITTTWSTSTASTLNVLAASNPPRDKGVEPRRFNTP